MEIELNLVALIDKSLYLITSGLEYFFKNKRTAKCDDLKFFEDFISNTFGLVSFCLNYDCNLVGQIYNFPDISKCLKFGIIKDKNIIYILFFLFERFVRVR